MHTKWVCLFGALALVLATLNTASAAVSVGHRFGIYGNMGYGTYAMGDVNDRINLTDTLYTSYGMTGSKSNINGGFIMNGGLQYGILDYLIVGLEGGALFNYSYSTYSSSGIEGSATYWLPATTVGGFVKGALPVGERWLLTAGLGIDRIAATGSVNYSFTGHSESDQMNGTGVAINTTVGAQVFLGRVFSFAADMGYRSAVIHEVTDEDGRVIKKINSNENLTLDYSGLILQMGINLFF